MESSVSVQRPTSEDSPIWRSSPLKGLLTFLPIAAGAAVVEFVLGVVFDMGTDLKLVYMTLCFVFWWHFGFSFGGWPGSRYSESRVGRGLVNLCFYAPVVFLVGEIWKLLFDNRDLVNSDIGLWGQTAITAAAISLFFFDDTIVATDETRERPAGGAANLLWALLLVAPALVFLPPFWGAEPFYLPWWWFPFASIVGALFARWPFASMSMPRLGILHTGAVLILTLLAAAILNLANMNLLETTNGPVFLAILTIVIVLWVQTVLHCPGMFDMWHLGHPEEEAEWPLEAAAGRVG